ncbi:hypothetical protein D3C72_2253990 [compost metagenome]
MILLDRHLRDIGEDRIGAAEGDERHAGKEGEDLTKAAFAGEQPERQQRRLPDDEPEGERGERSPDRSGRRRDRIDKVGGVP